MTFAPGEPLYHLCRPAPDYVPDGVLHGPIPDPARAYELCERLSELMRGPSPNKALMSRGTLVDLLTSLLVRKEGDAVAGSPVLRPALSSRVRSILDSAVYHDPPNGSPREILSSLDYRYEHLCRLFRATYGVPPLQYLHARRIARAQSLLRDTRMTVAEVGYKTGFRSAAHFTRLFKALTGHTPTTYRRHW